MGWLTALVGGGAAVLGGIVVAVSNERLRRAQQQDEHRAELRRATADFLAVIDLVGMELERQPQAGKTVSAINRLVERFPQLDYTTERLHERLFAPHLRGVLDRFSHAASRLVLVAPQPILEAVEDLAALLGRADEIDEDWKERWYASRGRLVVEARGALVETPRSRAGLVSRIGGRPSRTGP